MHQHLCCVTVKEKNREKQGQKTSRRVENPNERGKKKNKRWNNRTALLRTKPERKGMGGLRERNKRKKGGKEGGERYKNRGLINGGVGGKGESGM